MNGNASGLELRDVAQLQVAEPAIGIRQAIERSIIEVRHLHHPICPQALQPMDSPNFGTRMNIEKRENFARFTPGDDNHSRPAVAYDLL